MLDSRKSSPALLSSDVAPKVNVTAREESSDVASESVTIGKYLKDAKKDSSTKATKQKKSEKKSTAEDVQVNVGVSRLPPPPKKTSFGDFSGW